MEVVSELFQKVHVAVVAIFLISPFLPRPIVMSIILCGAADTKKSTYILLMI